MTCFSKHSTQHLPGHSIKKSYSGVDLFKFFFSLCIVALHTNALQFLPDPIDYFITKIVLRAAVPYFFVASGFFLGQKLFRSPKEQYPVIIRSYCLRLIKPLIFFEIISLAYHGFGYLRAGESLLRTVCYLGRSAVFYPLGALWYVQACIVGVLLLYPFLKRDRLNTALLLGFVLYGFALMGNNYSFLIEGTPVEKLFAIYLKICVSPRNGLFTGFFTIGLGIFCCQMQEKCCSPRATKRIFFLALMVYTAEVFLISKWNPSPMDDGSLYLSHTVLIPVLFFVTLQLNVSISPKTSLLLRNLSTGIYFLHRPVLYISSCYLAEGWQNFLVVLSVSIMICLIAYLAEKKTALPGIRFFAGLLK